MAAEKNKSNVRNAIWWGCFLFPAVWLQRLVPGVDFLLAGLLLTLQERRYADLVWVLPLLIILQEGMGSREFGLSLLWYTAAMLLFFLGRWLFDVQTFLYAFLFSACLGACGFALVFLTSPLYAAHLDVQRLLDESVRQGLLLPLVWKAAGLTRRWVYGDDAEYTEK